MSQPSQGAYDDAPIASSKHHTGHRELVASAVTIDRPASELYEFWRDFRNLPQVLENVVSIDPIDETHSRWIVRGPAGSAFEWISEITKDIPGEEITWQSDKDADVANSGRICFQHVPGRGTVVTATIAYEPPGGTLGKVVAKIFQREPKIQSRRDLRRFKQLMETGEIATKARNKRLHAEETE